MTTDYHRILKIAADASDEEIKKAYRKRAKELHPDRNKRPDAHEQFILLTEAYEFLINHRTFKTRARPAPASQEWPNKSRDEARERARQHARMRYEEYIQTDFYKDTEAAFVIWDHFYPISCLAIIIGAPAYGYYTKGTQGVVVGTVMVVLTARYWMGVFTEKHEINLSSLWQAMLRIGKTKAFHYSLITILNLYILFAFTFNTELDTLILMLSGTIVILIFYLFSNKITRQFKFITTQFLLVCIAPYFFNLFFLVNFIFSSDPQVESHSFYRLDQTTNIYLKFNHYETNPWFRTFFDYDSMKSSDRITYRFETGLFGLRVLKSYKFN